MAEKKFIDYYELLQVSPNASFELIERVFRHLAKKVHPDNPVTGDFETFNQIMEAYETLSDPEKRAAYDSKHKNQQLIQYKIAEEASSGEPVDSDKLFRYKLLTLLYVTRRRNVSEPGLGIFEIQKLLDVPEQHLEFHVWYLKEKNWILTTPTGKLAITVDGVDALTEIDMPLRRDRLLPEQTQ